MHSGITNCTYVECISGYTVCTMLYACTYCQSVNVKLSNVPNVKKVCML